MGQQIKALSPSYRHSSRPLYIIGEHTLQEIIIFKRCGIHGLFLVAF